MHCFLVMIKSMSFLYIYQHRLAISINIILIHFKFRHHIEASNVTAKQTSPQRILLKLVLHFNLLVQLVISLNSYLLKKIVSYVTVIAMAHLLWILVVPAKWACLIILLTIEKFLLRTFIFNVAFRRVIVFSLSY